MRHPFAGLCVLTSWSFGHAQISGELWNKATRAMDLSELVYLTRDAIAEFGDDYFNDDYDDAALIDSRTFADTCIIAFRGSTPEDDFPLIFARDLIQNFQLHMSPFCTRHDNRVCCDTHVGFVQGYETNYQADLERLIDDCLYRRKELIFTGHSQGAGIAQVAALRYAAANPKVLLFAPPFAFQEACLGRLITNDMISFVNTERHVKKWWFESLEYDVIIMLSVLEGMGVIEGPSELLWIRE